MIGRVLKITVNATCDFDPRVKLWVANIAGGSTEGKGETPDQAFKNLENKLTADAPLRNVIYYKSEKASPEPLPKEPELKVEATLTEEVEEAIEEAVEEYLEAEVVEHPGREVYDDGTLVGEAEDEDPFAVVG